MIKLTHEGSEGMTQGRNEVEFINCHDIPCQSWYRTVLGYSVELDTGAVSDATQWIIAIVNEADERIVDNVNDANEQIVDNSNDAEERIVDSFNNAGEWIVDNVNLAGEQIVDNVNDAGEWIVANVKRSRREYCGNNVSPPSIVVEKSYLKKLWI